MNNRLCVGDLVLDIYTAFLSCLICTDFFFKNGRNWGSALNGGNGQKGVRIFKQLLVIKNY